MGPSVRRERPVDGKGARYITPLHTVAWGGAEDSSGTNVFSQALTEESGLCANPAFGMKLQFLTLVRDQKAQMAVVAPRWDGSVLRGTLLLLYYYKMLYWINWIVLLSLEPLAGELEYASVEWSAAGAWVGRVSNV